MTALRTTFLLTLLLLAACGGASPQPDPVADVEAVITQAVNEENINRVEEAVGDIIADAVSADATLTNEEAMDLVSDVVEATENDGQNDANTGTDAGDSRDEATLIEPGSYSGAATFGVDELSLDRRDVYRVNASAGQTVRVMVTNTLPEFSIDFDIYSHTDERVYVGLFEPGATESAELALTDDGHVDIVLMAEQYEFSVEVVDTPAAEVEAAEPAEEAAVNAFMPCELLSAENVQQALAIESAPDVSSEGDSCVYAFSVELITVIFSKGLAGDIDFYRNAGGEEVALGDNATYINTQGQSILVWTVGEAVYQLGGLDFMNGMVSADSLIQIAQAVTR